MTDMEQFVPEGYEIREAEGYWVCGCYSYVTKTLGEIGTECDGTACVRRPLAT